MDGPASAVSDPAGVDAELGFFAGPHGEIPLACWWPTASHRNSACIIHCPAFAEEMNRSRHMVARQARAFAANGYAVVVPDLAGTGDSPAELAEASWAAWREEILHLVAEVRAAGYSKVVLWGLRLGCLLAVEVAALVEKPLAGLLLWQPLQSGRQQMAQFLRLAAAGAMLAGDKASSATLRAELDAGGGVDIAGYHLSAALYRGICGAQLGQSLPSSTAVALLEVLPDSERGLGAASRKQVEDWASQGINVQAACVGGESFWATQELGFADPLLARSVEEVRRIAPSPSAATVVEPRRLSISRCSRDGALRAVSWDCGGDHLVGMLHEAGVSADSDIGVVIAVGGPQYRVGSHRQFFRLASALAEAGVPALRFDYRGMRDAEGELGGFLTIAPDIDSAVSALQRECPRVCRVVLWGLCDAATAVLAYAPGDERVAGLVVANPWVYSPGNAARVRVKSYYLRRLTSGDFWRKLVAGRLKPGSSLKEFGQTLFAAVGQGGGAKGRDKASAQQPDDSGARAGSAGEMGPDLVANVADAADRLAVPLLLVLSGRDFTAQEFEQALGRDRALARAFERRNVRTERLPAADHTFSQPPVRARVEALSCEFLQAMGGAER